MSETQNETQYETDSPQAAPEHGGRVETAGPSRRASQGRRKPLACRRCQSRKIKCDGSKPKCSGCQRARVECVDGTSTSQGPSISKREAARLQHENRRLLGLLRERQADPDAAASIRGMHDRNLTSTAQPAEMSTTPMPTPDTTLTSPGAATITPIPGESTSATHVETPGGHHYHSGDIAHEIGMIPLSAGVNKYVGPSSGFSIAKLVLARVDQASGHHNYVGSHANETTAEARCRSMFAIKPSALPPSQDQAVQLSLIYFEQVHPRYPFLHQQSHIRSINDVYSGVAISKAIEFQVVMVLAISATILSRRLRIPFSGEGLCAAAMENADQIDYQSSTQGVQCLLLISMFTLHSPFLGINPWYLNYQCLAAVLDLGLQQDVPVSASIDPFEREMRTRLFWVVFSIDRIIATTLGRPLGLRDEACDLRLPETVEDDQLDVLRNSNVSTSNAASTPGTMSCAVVHFRLALLNSEIMSILHSSGVSPNASKQNAYPPYITHLGSWQTDLWHRLVKIRESFPTFESEKKHLLALCEIRYNEVVMLLFRPTPRIRTPSKDALTHCHRSAEATILLWKQLYNSDRMSYSWTSIHSICIGAITILYCVWMVRDLTVGTRIDSLTQTMVTASNLLSAAGEHWGNARQCRDSLNNLTAATIRWLVELRSTRAVKPGTIASVPQAGSFAHNDSIDTSACSEREKQHQQQKELPDSMSEVHQPFDSEYPWVDTYINGEDLATLFRAPNPLPTDLSYTVEGMFSEYQPLFDFYQGPEFGYDRSTVDTEALKRVAAKANISIPEHDVEGYLAVLQSAELTAAAVHALPDYIDERLSPTPTVGGNREYSRPQENDLNAWSHQTNLVADQPSSDLLAGRKIVIKDNMSLGGVPFTCGTFPQLINKTDRYPLSPIDATVVKRLLDNGATIVGTGTCENYSLTPMSYTSANGPVHNPWLRGHNAGGSSSGSACLLGLRRAREAGVPGLEGAGDDIDMALGGDQAGSIRGPASYCGVYGLKPTYGLVPYTGIAGLHPMIDHAGPMALRLDDIALLLQVLAGYDGLDGRMTPETPLRENVERYYDKLQAFTGQQTKERSLRVGIISESLNAPHTSPEVAKVVRDAAMKHFTAAGATVSEVSVPMHLLGPSIWTASCRNHIATLGAGCRVPDILTHNLPQWTPRWPPDQEMFDLLTHHNPAVIHVILGETMLGERFGPEAQAKAHRHVFQLRKAYDDALQDFDVLVTPTVTTVAPPHPDMRPAAEGGSSVLDKAKLALGSMNNTCQFNATGHPALSVPCGWAAAATSEAKNMLPVGMQLVGRRWDDLGVLKAARVFEIGGGGLGVWPGQKDMDRLQKL